VRTKTAHDLEVQLHVRRDEQMSDKWNVLIANCSPQASAALKDDRSATESDRGCTCLRTLEAQLQRIAFTMVKSSV
jgi:hypothetical protein